jgi:hypothetical protein
MGSFSRLFAVVNVVAAVAGCVTAKPEPQPMPITDSTQRFRFRGFSVVPPNGAGWWLMPVAPADTGPTHLVVMFAKEVRRAGSAGFHHASAEVHISNVGWRKFADADDLLQFEKDVLGRMVAHYVDLYHRVLAVRTDLDATLGAQCVRYELVVEHTASDAPTKSNTFEIRGYRCLHPRWPQYLIDVSYSETYATGDHAYRLDKTDAAPFLRSLRFTDEQPGFVNGSER